jgi:hypothetical protein
MKRPVALCVFFILTLPGTSLPQGCGSADPSYIRTATETGGIPMFLQRSEAGKSFHLVRESTRANVSTVLWATGSLSSQAQSFVVPIDSMTQRMTFTFSFDSEGNSVSIRAPSRALVQQDSPNTEVTELHCGRIVTLVPPEKGEWRLDLAGRGRFWLEAQAQSDIHIIATEFVRTGGRPGHEGYFRIDGQPLAGRPAMMRANASTSDARSIEFWLADERGGMLRKLQLRRISSTEEFMGTIDLPEVPFRMVMTGLDANGWPYQRFFAPLFHAEGVEVSWNRTFDEMPAGSVKQVQFTVRNNAFPRTFSVIATDARRFVSKVEPRELALGPGQSGTILVDLMVPAGTAAGLGDDVVVVATSTAGPATSNSSVAHFSVTR